MFQIYVFNGKEMPKDDICYIIAKQGIFLKKKVGMIESITKVDKISTLNEITPWAKIIIPKIPGSHVAKIISFFKEINETIKGEANVLIYYNKENKKFKMIVPKQKVTASSCDYTLEGLTVPNYNLIGTIHSHANMSAFHSSTDDKDEHHFDGLHITIGNISDLYPSITASIVVNGFRVVIEPCDYIDECIEVDPTETILSKLCGSGNTKYNNKRYNIQVSGYHKRFNTKWLKQVTQQQINYGNMFIKNQQDIQQYFNCFDSEWDPFSDSRLNKNILEPDHLQKMDEDYNPCMNCLFRDTKLEYAYDILQTGIDPGEDLPEENNYKSRKEESIKLLEEKKRTL